ncbi:MAG: HAD-IIB family hydrolase [Thermodesulfobacteriota bacterium]
MDKNYIIISDMDGTLLDPATYSFDPALPALGLIRELGVPLVLCSSKTRAEIEYYRGLLANTDPFISENGGGVFIPEGYFPFEAGEKTPDGYEAITLGAAYADIRKAFREIQERTGIGATGFGDMDTRDVAIAAGLSTEEAELARRRDFDEPFAIDPGGSERVFLQAIEDAGFRWNRGDRFHHMLGANDKGKAVEVLKGLYAKAGRRVTTVGIGDTHNDIPLLEAVDIAVIVQKVGGCYDSAIEVDGLVRAPGIGPFGWNAFVVDLLGKVER